MNFKFTKHRSFTLTEILVVAGILAILTATAMAGLRIQNLNQAILGDARKVANLLEKAQSYAAHPRSEDYRPLYYLVRFEVNNSSGDDYLDGGIYSSFQARLLVFEDTDNDGAGNRSSIIETVRLSDNYQFAITDINIPGIGMGAPFRDKDNIVLNAENRIKTCNATSGFISLGYRVGNPNQILGRCYDVGGNLSGHPGIIFRQGNIGIVYRDVNLTDAYRSSGFINGRWTFLRIDAYGETIQVCQGTFNDAECF